MTPSLCLLVKSSRAFINRTVIIYIICTLEQVELLVSNRDFLKKVRRLESTRKHFNLSINQLLRYRLLLKLSTPHEAWGDCKKSQTDVTFPLTLVRIIIVFSERKRQTDLLLKTEVLTQYLSTWGWYSGLFLNYRLSTPRALTGPWRLLLSLATHTQIFSHTRLIYDPNMKCHLWKSALRNERICMQKWGKISNKNQSFQEGRREFISVPQRCHVKYDETHDDEF